MAAGCCSMFSMNSKSRIVAVFVLGLASAMIVAGVLLPRLFPEERPVPLGLQHTTFTLEDEDATVGPGYLGVGKDEPIQAPVARQFNMQLGQPATEEEATVRVGVSNARTNVDDDLESLLDAQVYSYRLNRMNGEAVGEAKVSDSPATPPKAVELEGSWAKFPVDTKQQSYEYFDWTARHAYPAEFRGTERRETSSGGEKEIYLFRQEIPAEKVSSRYSGIRNAIVKDGDRAELYHGGWRELAVEPASGMIVGIEEHIQDEYRNAEGEAVEPLLTFEGRTTEANERLMLDQADELGGKRSTEKWGRGVFWAGVILLLAALVVALRRERKRRATSV